MSGFFYKPTKKDMDELDNKLKLQSEKLKENKRRLKEKMDFKERTGLKGPELKKAFEEYWNNGNPKDEFDALMNAYEYDRNPTFTTEKGLGKKIKNKKYKEKEGNIMNLDEFLKFVEEDRAGKLIEKLKKENSLKSKDKNLAYKIIEEDIKNYGYLFKPKKEPKTYKEGEIMNIRSELVKKNNKYSIDTELNINNDIDDKVKRALIKSIIEELNKKFDDYKFFYQKKN